MISNNAEIIINNRIERMTSEIKAMLMDTYCMGKQDGKQELLDRAEAIMEIRRRKEDGGMTADETD